MKRAFYLWLLLVPWAVQADNSRFMQGLQAYEQGQSVKALTIFSELADSKYNPNAMAILMKQYAEGIGTHVDQGKSLQMMRGALQHMDRFDPNLAYQTALMFKRMGDDKLALDSFLEAAKYQHADAAYEVAKYKLDALDQQIVEMTKWAIIADKLGSEQAYNDKPLFKSYIPSRDLRDQGKQQAIQWIKAHQGDFLQQEHAKAKEMAKALGVMGGLMQGLGQSIELQVDNSMLEQEIERAQQQLDR